jgi:hypothetical protein
MALGAVAHRLRQLSDLRPFGTRVLQDVNRLVDRKKNGRRQLGLTPALDVARRGRDCDGPRVERMEPPLIPRGKEKDRCGNLIVG